MITEYVDKLLRFGAKKLLVYEEVDDQTRALRHSICKSNACGKYNKDGDSCNQCLCFCDVKSSSKTNWNPRKNRSEITHCPLGFWMDKEVANKYRKIDNLPPLK